MRIKEILLREKNNQATAVYYKEQTITYCELYERVKKVSQMIKSYSGENIILYVPNSIDYYIAFFSVLFVDGIAVPMHFSDTVQNVEKVCRQTGSRLIITNDRQADQFADFDLLVIEQMELRQKGVLGKQDNYCAKDTAVLIETSGSTSDSKLIMLTNKNILSNIHSYKELIGEISDDEKALITSFLGSSHGNTCQMLFYLYYKIPAVIYDGLTSMTKILKTIQVHKITRAHFVSTILIVLCKIDPMIISRFDLSSLQYIEFGSCVFPRELLPKLLKRFPDAIFVQVYGLSEAAPLVTGLDDSNWRNKFGSIGKPVDGLEVYVDSISQNPNIGELCVRGPNVMAGYFKNREANMDTLVNGWLKTKDIVELDRDGYLYYIGRKDRMIKSSGYRINPEEIEEYILTLKGVEKVYVHKVKDNIRGEMLIADIIPDPFYFTSKEDIIIQCRKYLAFYKIPHIINVVKSLKCTKTGKIKVIPFRSK